VTDILQAMISILHLWNSYTIILPPRCTRWGNYKTPVSCKEDALYIITHVTDVLVLASAVIPWKMNVKKQNFGLIRV